MKKILLSIVMVLMAYSGSLAGPNIQGSGSGSGSGDMLKADNLSGLANAGTAVTNLGQVVDVRAYASINAAVTAIGATQTTLVVPNAQTLTANLTIPSTLSLQILKGGSIAKASTYTLTINGPFEAGLYTVFTGFSAGNVTFGVSSGAKTIEAAWFGAVGDTVVTNGAFISGTASDVAINSAIAAAQGLHAVHIHDGVFKITESLVPVVNTQGRTYEQGMSIYGNGHSTVLVNVATASKPTFALGLNRGGFIRNLAITGVEANPNTGIDMNNTRNFLVENVSLDPMGHGIYAHGLYVSENTFRNISIWWDCVFWGTTAIRTLSNTNNYDGVSFIATAGDVITQNTIDGLNVNGGRYGIYSTQATFGNSVGLYINNYLNANTDRGIYTNQVKNVNITNWYIANGSGGDYAGYFDNSPYVTLRNCNGDYGALDATYSIKFVNANSTHITMDSVYLRGNLELASLAAAGGFFASNVNIIGDFTGTNPSTLDIYSLHNVFTATLSYKQMMGAVDVYYNNANTPIPFKINDTNGYGIYLSGENQLNFNYGLNATGDGYINYHGYANGTGTFRNLHISDGKQADIVYFDGTTGNSLFRASSYLNWGATSGTSGYGFRDNAGVPEFKASGGAWAAIGASSMVYPGAGVPVSTGSAWGTSLNITAISDSTSTTSSTTAASATAVKAAYDLANGKEAADSDLSAIAALACTENQIIKRNGAGAWVCGSDDNSGSATAINDIGDATGDGTIAQTGYKQIFTSTLNAAGAVWTMTNTTADLTADVSFIDFKYTDVGDANGFFMRGYDNASDLKWSIGADGAFNVGSLNIARVTTVSATDPPQTFVLYESTDDGNSFFTITVPAAGTGLTGNRTGTLPDRDITFDKITSSSDTDLVGLLKGVGGKVAAAGLIPGTLTDTYLCTYTASGTLLSCNTNPASFLNQDTTGSAVYWKTSGTGKAAITGPATGQTRTYTFPDADATVITKATAQPVCTVIAYPTAASDYPVWKAPTAVTIVAGSIHVYSIGGTNVVGGLDECTGTNGTCGSVTAVDADITGTAGNDVADDGSLTNPTIASGAWVQWHTTSISGTPTSVSVCFNYTID